MADEILRKLGELRAEMHAGHEELKADLKAEMRAGHSAILAKVEANYELIIEFQKDTTESLASVAEALEALHVDRAVKVAGRR